MSLCKHHNYCPYFANNGDCRAAPRNREDRCGQYLIYMNGQGETQRNLWVTYGPGERRGATPEEIRRVIERSRR